MAQLPKRAKTGPDKPKAKRSSMQPDQSTLAARSVSVEEVAAFMRDLSARLEAGEAIVPALVALADTQANAGLQKSIRGLSHAVRAGSDLSEAMARHPIFSDLVDDVRRAENEGRLGAALRGLGDADGVLSFEQAIEFLGTSKPTLYRLLAEKKLKGLKVGRQWRFRRADLVAYMERKPETVSSTQFEDLEAELKYFQTLTKRQLLPAKGFAEERDAEYPGERLVVTLTNAILIHAIESGASDIHLEMTQSDILLRVRIDGVLHEVRRLPLRLDKPLFNRFKVMADLNLDERNLPQDGRIHLKMDDKSFDLRVNWLPTTFGGSLVMCVLLQQPVSLEMGRLEFSESEESTLRDWSNRPHGLIVACGPDGSGKTTTLYSLLNAKLAPQIKTMTIEDPVEQTLPYATQTHVNRKAGLAFAPALRAIMRQDPDLIYASTVPDRETSQLVLEAAVTGHLVFVSLPSMSAAGAVQHLVELSEQPFAVSSNLVGVVSQRLVRRICEHCKQTTKPSAALLKQLRDRAARGGFEIPARSTFYTGAGCDKCRRNGYRGRVPIYEILPMSAALSEAILNSEGAETLRDIAVADGMRTLAAAGARRVVAGDTSIEEVARVLFTSAA